MTQTFKRSRKIISGVGWSNPLTHDFQLENSSHLKVWADATLLQLGVDYTLDEVGNPAGYEVNIVIPAPGAEPVWWGNDLFILSVEPPVDQGDDLSLGGSFGVKFETAIDKLTRRLQHVYDMALRAYKSPLTTDPTTLDQDDLVFEPGLLPELIEAAAAAVAAADAAEADALQTAQDRVVTGQDRTQTGLDRAAVAADKGTVAADKATVAADKATVGGYRDDVEADRSTIEGYRDEVEADRVDVQADKVVASAAADAAALAQAAAEAARDATLLAFDNFDDRYLGSKAADPALDNDGNALVGGALYFNTTTTSMMVYTGSAWVAAYIDGTGVLLKAQNLADLQSVATARTNLDVYSKAQIDAMPGSVAEKVTPIDADSWTIWDSVASAWKRVTGTNLKVYLKAYFDTLYALAVHTHTQSQVTGLTTGSSPQFTAVNVGHASDSTLGRTSAGILNIEGVDIIKASGAQSLTGKTYVDPLIQGTIREDVFAITDAAGFAIDPTNGSVQRVTLGANRTPVPANWDDGESVTLYVADGTAFSITWTGFPVVWKDGTAPTLATSGYTEINIVKENGVYRGVTIGDFAS